MKNLSLKIEDEIFKETELALADLGISRNRYINRAIDFYNRYNRRRAMEKQMAIESKLVAEDSMSVLREFEQFEFSDASV